MIDVDDIRWRDAAANLDLELVDADGNAVDRASATRDARMRGIVDGAKVRVRYGFRDPRDRIVVTHVRLKQPLLLGLRLHSYAPPKRSAGGSVGGPLRFSIEGIERGRAVAMFDESSSGRALTKLLRWFGSLGWAQLTDSEFRAQSEVYSDGSLGYVHLIRSAVRVTALAELARSEIVPAEWENALRANLQNAATELRLAVDATAFGLVGVIRGMRTSFRLDAGERYALAGRIEFPTPLADGSAITRRLGPWSTVAAFLGLDRPSRDVAFNALFRAIGPIRDRLSPDVTATLLELARDAEVNVDARAIDYRTMSLDSDPTRIVSLLAQLAERLLGKAGGSPYR